MAATAYFLVILLIVAVLAAVLFAVRKRRALSLGRGRHQLVGEDRPHPAAAVAAAAAPSPLLPLHEDVQFTVYRPRAVEPLSWETLLAFAHLSDRPIDAGPDEPDPVTEVERLARQSLGDRAGRYIDLRQDSAYPIPQEAEITFVPYLPGFVFNPPRCTFLWLESVHQESFRMRAAADLDGRVAQGRFSIFRGSLLLAEIQLAIRVHRGAAAHRLPPEVQGARPFGNVFPSYSHQDAAVVDEMERAARTLGHRYLRDVTSLRAGEEWSSRLEQLIQEADIFQLFWSRNAMQSPYVEREWRYALSLNRHNYVRPTYWEEPLPRDRQRGLPPPELERLHFHQLHRATGDKAGAAVRDDQPAMSAALPHPPTPIAAGGVPDPHTATYRAPLPRVGSPAARGLDDTGVFAAPPSTVAAPTAGNAKASGPVVHRLRWIGAVGAAAVLGAFLGFFQHSYLSRSKPMSSPDAVALSGPPRRPADDAGPARSRRVALGQVLLINDSSSVIREVYALASGEGSQKRQKDLLGSRVLKPGERILLNVDDATGHCFYDFKAVRQDGADISRGHLDTCEAARWRITDLAH
jgi:hypothetical protein